MFLRLDNNGPAEFMAIIILTKDETENYPAREELLSIIQKHSSAQIDPLTPAALEFQEQVIDFTFDVDTIIVFQIKKTNYNKFFKDYIDFRSRNLTNFQNLLSIPAQYLTKECPHRY